MTDDDNRRDGLTAIPLAARAEWREKVVTTDPPRYIPHSEWELDIFLSADAPMRAAVVLISAGHIQWGLEPHVPASELKVRARFAPYSWKTSDEVQVGIGWQRLAVTDPDLKQDPRQVVEIIVPPRAATGSVVPVAALATHALQLSVFPVAERDTEPRRMDRWRVRPSLAHALPGELRELSSGHQTGTGPLPA
jgi:hypothetical protein